MKYSSIAFAVFLPLLLITSCSVSKRTSKRSPLDVAIAHYISGETEISRDELVRLTQELDGSDLCEAYLYLGRCHLALGAMEEAAETFTLGGMTCGGDLFDEYLQQVQNYLRAAPEVLVRAASISRAQFACLILHYFGSSAAADQDLKERPADIESHWAAEAIETVLKNGYLEVLPDGKFYPDEPVRRAAFVFQTGRLVRLVADDPSIDLEGAFPAAVRQKIDYFAGIALSDDESALISGREAVNLLDNIARKTGYPHGD